MIVVKYFHLVFLTFLVVHLWWHLIIILDHDFKFDVQYVHLDYYAEHFIIKLDQDFKFDVQYVHLHYLSKYCYLLKIKEHSVSYLLAILIIKSPRITVLILSLYFVGLNLYRFDEIEIFLQ